ncbi:MAG: HIT family protein [Bacteroidales bacterium]|nr:HIT family protein [Bacteroidales bacterium]
MDTIFSKIIQGEIPCYKVAEDDNFFAFLDINPLAVGHTLVVPKKVTDYIFDMEDKELGDMIVFAKKVAKAIKANYPCAKVGMTVIGLEVPHAHIHLVPINGVNDIDFRREKVKLSDKEYKSIAARLAASIE